MIIIFAVPAFENKKVDHNRVFTICGSVDIQIN